MTIPNDPTNPETRSMPSNPNVHRGTVHGRIIELADETGLPEGQEVAVTLQAIPPGAEQLPPGEGLRRAFGGWADDAGELDEYLEWSREQRQKGRPEIDG